MRHGRSFWAGKRLQTFCLQLNDRHLPVSGKTLHTTDCKCSVPLFAIHV